MTLLPSPPRPCSPASRPAVAAGRDLRWVLSSRCPRGWRGLLERCGGGPFHAPPGLAASAPAGTRVFAELQEGDTLVGAAAGVGTRCRFGVTARHFYFPSLPAVAEPAQREAAVASLVEALRARGVADVQFDSFDASWRPGPGTRDRAS